MRVAAIILAAGASRRMGTPKQLALLHGETLLARAIRVAREADCLPVVVLGAHAEEIVAACHLHESEIVHNPHWQGGMSTSIALGVQHASAFADAVIIMACDQPAVTPEHLKQLMQMGEQSGQPVSSAYSQRRGIPAYFPRENFPELTLLTGDTGARDLLAHSEALILLLGEADLDTPEALAQAQSLFASTQD